MLSAVGTLDARLMSLDKDFYRTNQERNFDHCAKDLLQLEPGDCVWMRDQDRDGEILRCMNHLRSYLVRSDMGTVRRNQSALVSHEMKSNL